MKRKPSNPSADMFAVLEHQERTAHFPSPSDLKGCRDFYAAVLGRYDAAMMAADTAGALAVKSECELFLDGLIAAYDAYRATNGGPRRCYRDLHTLLAKRTRARAGAVPMWGQAGSFTLTVAGVPVLIEAGELCGIGMYGENLLPHFAIHIVEKHRLFLSQTGYRSFFCHLTDVERGMTVADVVGRILREYVQREMKGKLVAYDPLHGYSGVHRQKRAVELGLAAGPEPEPEPLDEDEAEELYCDGCDDALSQLDEYTESECGRFCGACLLEHSRNCGGCTDDLVKAHGGVHPAPYEVGELEDALDADEELDDAGDLDDALDVAEAALGLPPLPAPALAIGARVRAVTPLQLNGMSLHGTVRGIWSDCYSVELDHGAGFRNLRFEWCSPESPAALPGFASAVTEQAEAAAAVAGERLTAELGQSAGNISAAAGRMEIHSPLFCESTANPQLSLF